MTSAGPTSSLVDFRIGDPDLPLPAAVVDAAAAACADPLWHGYLPIQGALSLRSAVAERACSAWPDPVDPDQVLVTSGVKPALFAALSTLLRPGDEVVLPGPVWPVMPRMVRLAGGTPVIVPGDAAASFRVSVEQLEEATTERTRVLVFASPANPTGAVYSAEHVAAIAEWAQRAGVFVIADEIYDNLVFDRPRFHSILEVAPDIADRCLVVNGLAKGFAMPGWRTGWMVGPGDAIRAAMDFQSVTFSSVPGVSQAAALAALVHGDQIRATVHEQLAERRDLLVSGLGHLRGLDCPSPEGGLFCLVSVHDLLDTTVGGREVHSDTDLAEVLLDQCEVAVLPGDPFGAPGFVRMSFGPSQQAIHQGIRQLERLL